MKTLTIEPFYTIFLQFVVSLLEDTPQMRSRCSWHAVSRGITELCLVSSSPRVAMLPCAKVALICCSESHFCGRLDDPRRTIATLFVCEPSGPSRVPTQLLHWILPSWSCFDRNRSGCKTNHWFILISWCVHGNG